jgi:uncharacterized membrane protein
MADQNTQVPPQAPVPPVSGGTSNDTLMGILSYLGILVLIPLLATKNRSPFLTLHINQGLILLIVGIVWQVVFNVVTPFALFLLPIWPIGNILLLILAIIGIVNVAKGESKILPVVGNWFHLVK